MKHKHVKSPSPRAKVSVVIERLEKTVDKKDAAPTTCAPHAYCIPPV
jgi:hypothetical protein